MLTYQECLYIWHFHFNAVDSSIGVGGLSYVCTFFFVQLKIIETHDHHVTRY